MRLLLLPALLLLGCTPNAGDTGKPPPPSNDSETTDDSTPPTDDADGDGIPTDTDCDDNDAAVGGPTDWYADNDADGYGAGSGTSACDAPTGAVADATDCDDLRADVSPAAAEVCDNTDNDCDAATDEDLVDITSYSDADRDSYGDPATASTACSVPDGRVENGEDCDDTNDNFHPGADEADCTNPNDYNCDGSVGYADADADGYAACAECDDTNAAISPVGTELCNGLDDDCDGNTDEDSSDPGVWYLDADADGYGGNDTNVAACDAPAGYTASNTDCDDTDATYHPDAEELDCTDPNDYNCDGSVGFADADADGYAACADCDDTNAAVSPAGTELCNGLDDDCDGNTDEDDVIDAVDWYLDADADGHGGDDASMRACQVPDGYAATNTDCDDSDPMYHPGADEPDCTDPNDYNCDGSVGYDDNDDDGYAACEDCDDNDSNARPDGIETCNGADDDCDGATDEDDAIDAGTWYGDSDADGYGDPAVSSPACAAPSGFIADNTDCDDTSPAVSPNGVELCNGVDDDCDGSSDEDSANDAGIWYADVDGDSFGVIADSIAACSQPPGYVANDQDCDDTSGDVSPDGTESCNGIDDDCDGETDEDSATDAPTWYADTDEDSFGDAADSAVACSSPAGYVADDQDCDDTSSGVSPDAIETCNSIDDDCDGDSDENSALDAPTWYADTDGDSFGDAADSTVACSSPAGYVASDQDCDDTSPSVSPADTELCNGIDDDCDGATDENSAADAPTWYADDDDDGFGDPDTAGPACAQPEGAVSDDDDCDDSRSDVNPDATEQCDTIDNNCDEQIDEAGAVGETYWYADTDGDGFGDADIAVLGCSAPAGTVADTTDCDDGDSGVYPGATETCDGTDEDCDALIDEGIIGTGTCYAEDCAEILDSDPTAPSGFYTLDAGSYYCDMTTDDGGWTRVADDAAVYGTGYTGTYYNTAGFSWSEVLFQYASGSTHGHCTFPGNMTGCNPVGFQFGSENWGVAQNWGSSVCGLPLTYYTSATTYIGGYDWVISRGVSTSTVRVGMLEGVSSCTTSDNYGTAYLDVYVR